MLRWHGVGELQGKALPGDHMMKQLPYLIFGILNWSLVYVVGLEDDGMEALW